MSPPCPNCVYCWVNQGVLNRATLIAAQSTDAGKTIEWVPICDDHADGWNEGGDWSAPMYAISKDAADTPEPAMKQLTAAEIDATVTALSLVLAGDTEYSSRTMAAMRRAHAKLAPHE